SLGGVTPAAAQTAVGTQLDAADEQVLPKIYSTYGNFLAARKAELRDDTAAAAAYYRRVLERDPDNAEVLNRAYFFTGVEGDVEAAAQLARRLLIARPGDLLSPIVIATDMIAQDQVQDAVDLLSSVDQTGLNAFLVPVMLAWALAEQGETDKALVALDELKATDGVSGLRLLHTALVLDHAGRAEDAQAAFMAYADAQGDQATLRAIQLVGGYFVRNGQPDQAQAIAQRYTERFPDSLLVADATKGFADGDPPPALVVDARTGFAEVFYGTATLMLDSDPQTASLFSHLGLSLAPNFALTRLLLGQILSDRKQYLASEAIYRAISDDPNLHLAAGLAIADNQRAREEIDAAASTLQALAETYPDRPDPLIELGDLYRYEERFEESEVAYTAALERIPEPARRHWAVYFGRG
ncbi:MAG: tetratricopeptide repeat protein, partial [Rhodospirillaceae bacterium]